MHFIGSRSRQTGFSILPTVIGVLMTPIVFVYMQAFRPEFPMSPINDAVARDIVTPQGFKLHVYELKQADAKFDIIFIHGTPGESDVFNEEFKHPIPGADLLAYDRPGFGKSGGGTNPPSLDYQVAILGDLLPENPPRPVLLVGHSYGGPIALAAAIKYPERVAGALLIGGAIDPGLEKTVYWQKIGNTWPVEYTLPKSWRWGNRELISLKKDLLKLKAEIPELKVPVVMLHGMQDNLVPEENVAYREEQLSAAGKTNLLTARIYMDYNHFIPWEHPRAVNEAIATLENKTQR
jgi:pimeloyl-ACP methyl ester carboxylesterase